MITKHGKIRLEDFFVDRLNFFKNERNISTYKLCKITGISQTSMHNILEKKNCPSLYSIDRIIEGLDLTCEEFFKDEISREATILTKEERSLLNIWRKMHEIDRMMVFAFAQGIIAKEESEK